MAEWKREIVGTRSTSDVNEDVVRRAMIKYILEKINDRPRIREREGRERRSREERQEESRGGPITAVSPIRLASISTRCPDLIEVRRGPRMPTWAQKMSRKLGRLSLPRLHPFGSEYGGDV